MTVTTPTIRWWGGLTVDGLDALPLDGPVLLAGNHDSYWDPLAIGIAAQPRRQVKALAKASLWKIPGLGTVLDGMGQIPIERGAGDRGALDRAVAELRAGACIGVFLEGTRSKGRQLRARSGFVRLAREVPSAQIVLVAVEETHRLRDFPHRPSLRVSFFRPQTALTADRDPAELAEALLAEIRGRTGYPST